MDEPRVLILATTLREERVFILTLKMRKFRHEAAAYLGPHRTCWTRHQNSFHSELLTLE